MKLKTGLVNEYRERQEFCKEQKRLREKHSIQDDRIIVVEKKHYVKNSAEHCLEHSAWIIYDIYFFTGNSRSTGTHLSVRKNGAYGCCKDNFDHGEKLFLR